MNKQTLILFVVLGAAIAIVFGLGIARHRTADAQREQASPVATSVNGLINQRSGEPMESTGVTSQSALPITRVSEPISEQDMTPFLRSEIAEKWQRELGYTQEEILRAQKEIRAQRYPEEAVNNPGMIMRHLPPRHVGQVTIESVTIAPEVPAGNPIRFSVRGTAPSPSFHFTHFDVLVQGNIVRVQARGHADGKTDSGPGGPVTLDGTIQPLPPGEYSIEVAELGPMGSFPFTVIQQ